jgi:hypothetical protein
MPYCRFEMASFEMLIGNAITLPNETRRRLMPLIKSTVISRAAKHWLVPAFCVFHATAVFWWALPRNVGALVAVEEGKSLETTLMKSMALDDSPALRSAFLAYIDLSGSQQYWDFFAPHSLRSHQYLSVCRSLRIDEKLGNASCQGPALFSNLDSHIQGESGVFKVFGSDRSRYYRLTENLAKLDEAELLKTFAQYYSTHQTPGKEAGNVAYLVRHTFELHPELDDLPKPGYRIDQILLALP